MVFKEERRRDLVFAHSFYGGIPSQGRAGRGFSKRCKKHRRKQFPPRGGQGGVSQSEAKSRDGNDSLPGEGREGFLKAMPKHRWKRFPPRGGQGGVCQSDTKSRDGNDSLPGEGREGFLKAISKKKIGFSKRGKKPRREQFPPRGGQGGVSKSDK
jgi:hypothetical protein